MTDYGSVLEQAGSNAPSPDLDLERILRRRDRKRRNDRILAGVVGMAFFLAVVWIVSNAGSIDRSETPAETGPTVTGPAETGPSYKGPAYTLGPVSEKDIAVGESFMQAWIEGDGEAAEAMFSPEGTFDGFSPTIFPALHDWFRASGWSFGDSPFEDAGCGAHGWGTERGVVGCGFTYENDFTRALDMRPVPMALSFAIEGGTIRAAWFGAGGDCCYNVFGSPDPIRGGRWGQPDLSGAVWDMFIEWLSTSHPEDFGRMYDPDYGYPVRGYPILDPGSIELWERYTDEFVTSHQELARSLTEWMANQGFEVQAGRICMAATEEFFTRARAGDLRGRAFNTAVAESSEETLAELRALPLATEADRATMDQFVPLAERWIELFRGEGSADWFFNERKDVENRMDRLIPGCLIHGFGG